MSISTKKLDASRVGYIVVHCAATPPSMDIGAAEIDRWHRQRGMSRIGYHFVIRRDGTLETGRPLSEVGAHAVGFNLVSVGICLVGGVGEKDKSGALGPPEANYTEAQLMQLADLIRDLSDRYFPKAKVLGHRDLPSAHARLKACPSFDVRAWLDAGMPLTISQ